MPYKIPLQTHLGQGICRSVAAQSPPVLPPLQPERLICQPDCHQLWDMRAPPGDCGSSRFQVSTLRCTGQNQFVIYQFGVGDHRPRRQSQPRDQSRKSCVSSLMGEEFARLISHFKLALLGFQQFRFNLRCWQKVKFSLKFKTLVIKGASRGGGILGVDTD